MAVKMNNNDNNEKSCIRNRVSHKIDFKAQIGPLWLRNGNADNVEVSFEILKQVI